MSTKQKPSKQRKTVARAAYTLLRALGWNESGMRPCTASLIDMLELETELALVASKIDRCVTARAYAKRAMLDCDNHIEMREELERKIKCEL